MRPQLVAVVLRGAKAPPLPFLFPTSAAVDGEGQRDRGEEDIYLERMKYLWCEFKFARGRDWIIARLILWNDCSKEVGRVYFSPSLVRG